MGAHDRVPDLRQQVAPRHVRRARPPPARPEPDLPGADDRGGDRDAVVRALRQINPQQRQAVVLHYLCDLSVDQIATETGVPVSTVKTRLFRGRQALAPLLAPAADPEGASRA